MSASAGRAWTVSARRRFSTAHEVAHYCLSHHRNEALHVDPVQNITIRALYRSTDSAGTRKEAEANHFAACLLLPRRRVDEESRKLSRAGGLTDIHVEELAKLFRVSQAAMTIRLQVLDLL
jgi:Zn-dependent peptidase ImmA (M78 family)